MGWGKFQSYRVTGRFSKEAKGLGHFLMTPSVSNGPVESWGQEEMDMGQMKVCFEPYEDHNNTVHEEVESSPDLESPEYFLEQ